MCKERMKNGHIMPTQRVFEEVEQFYMDNFMSSDINVSCKIDDGLFFIVLNGDILFVKSYI